MRKQKKAMAKQPAAKSIHDDKHYHEEMTYDSKREQWPGLAALLLIPLFIFIMGFGFYSVFHLPKAGEPSNGLQFGVGGGPDVTFTPTPSLERPIKGEDLNIVQ